MSEIEHNVAPYFNSKLDFIMSEFSRLQEALGVEDTVRLAVDLKLQVEFTETTLTEAAQCGATATAVKNILVGSRKFPALLMDDFLGAAIIDNNVRIFELDPDSRPQGAAFEVEPAVARKVGGKAAAKKKKKKVEADGGWSIPGAGAQAVCAPPIEIPLTHPFLAKARVQFIDDALLVTQTEGGSVNCEECPNVFKSHPVYKHATLPTLLRPIPSDDVPLPADFFWADLPDATNDELECLCQGERIIIEEMTFPENPDPSNPEIWSNFCGDQDGIPAAPGAKVDPTADGLLGVITAEAIVVARADSDAWLQTFCCPTQIIPGEPDCAEIDLKNKAPFENVTALLADGGVEVPLVRGGRPVPKYLEKAKAKRIA